MASDVHCFNTCSFFVTAVATADGTAVETSVETAIGTAVGTAVATAVETAIAAVKDKIAQGYPSSWTSRSAVQFKDHNLRVSFPTKG